ncbi:MAG TPA: efflux RND transporter periplasmic adaptor subunit [Thermoanaerobaculia bacterium]|nr:efflux RND transporter periplasmic adaptor subunit [Thermoanaerobaculia bacterium]
MNLGERNRRRSAALLSALLLPVALGACGGQGGAGGPGGAGAGGPGGAPMAMPVPVSTVAEAQLRDATEYVATLKSRHTTNVQPQVEGVLGRIFVKSGDRVTAGTPLMQIDPAKQRATVRSQEATRAQKLAALNYAREQRNRMETLYKGGAASKQQLDEAQTAMAQAQADYDAVGAQVQEQEVQLAYYRVTAPTAGVVGDIPVRTGDRVTTSTLLTTIDQNDALEVYISVPLDRAKDLRMGLPVEVLGDNGEVIANTQVNFISPQVDDQTQEVLVKAPVPNGQRGLRAEQFAHARLVWKTHPGVVVPVLAVSRINGQYFVFAVEQAGPGGPGGPGGAGGPGGGAAGGKGGPGGGGPGGPGGPGAPAGGGTVAHQRPITVGDVVGNDYVVLAGLKPGDRIVASGVQKLADGMPIMPLPAGPPGGPPGSGAPGGAPGSSSGAGGA